MQDKTNRGNDLKLSFEFFPPKSPDMEGQLWSTVRALKAWSPEFVSVTYGAGGTTRDTTLSTVARMIRDEGLPAASHLTCVGASKAEVDLVVEAFAGAGVRRFLALRGDPQGGIGTAYQAYPGGYSNAAELVEGLMRLGDYDISVAAYPEKHPESRDVAADIDMLKRKVDNGARRAVTQFFFDNDTFERYLERVRAAGVTIPILPGILPVHNLGQVKKFASLCGASVPKFLDDALGPVDDDAEERTKRAVDLAIAQVTDLIGRGISEFHFYTMNRPQMVSAVLEGAGFASGKQALRTAAA